MKPKCIYLGVRQAGDEEGHYCTEAGKWCSVEAGYPYDTYNDWLATQCPDKVERK
ncbi:hypothetical protein LCGC14_2816290 [marine sediment metagenome]|uniref:Uncharacterized protein n=1 Tax=marine sediment metagenome TaxID=412755 RepID=A0A0F8YIC3_9ZZZZ